MPDLQTGPLSEINVSSFFGVEEIIFSTADPRPTANLRFDAVGGASFQADGEAGAWIVSPGGAVRLSLNLLFQHGLVMIGEMRPAVFAGGSPYPVHLQANESTWETEIYPAAEGFEKFSWYLLHYMLRQGENQIILRVPPEAPCALVIKSAAIMRFNLQMQQQDKWCWAAVTASFLNHLNPAGRWNQCQVVKTVLGKAASADASAPAQAPAVDCCQDGGDAACNRTYKLSQALQEMGLLDAFENRALTLTELRRRISEGVPLAIRIGWRDENGKLSNRGHFITITAVGPEDPRGEEFTWIRVADPIDKVASYVPYETLKNNYKGEGKWTHSYMISRKR